MAPTLYYWRSTLSENFQDFRFSRREFPLQVWSENSLWRGTRETPIGNGELNIQSDQMRKQFRRVGERGDLVTNIQSYSVPC